MLGVVLQNPEHQIVASTVQRDLAFGLEVRRVPRPQMRERILDVAHRVGLHHVLTHSSTELSAGERQRLVLGGVLACGPRYLLLDEPTSLLDAPSRAALYAVLRDELARGTGVLLVSQFPDEAVDADDVIVLEGDGRARTQATRAAICCIETESFHEQALEGLHSTAARLAHRLRRRDVWLPMPVCEVEDLRSHLLDRRGPVRERDAPTTSGASRSSLREPRVPVLRLDRVGVGGQAGQRRLDGVSLDVYAGRALTLVGRSGSGKTSTLLVAAGVLAPSAGTVHGLTDLDGQIGLLLQFPERQLYRTTVLEEVMDAVGRMREPFMSDVAHESGGQTMHDAESYARSILGQVGLTDAQIFSRSPFSLSVGEQRRLALALQIARHPRIVLLDEPTAGLDALSADAVFRVLERLRNQGLALLIASHDLRVPDRLGGDVVWLQSGCVKAGGSLLEVTRARARVENPNVVDFTTPAWMRLTLMLEAAGNIRPGQITSEEDLLEYAAVCSTGASGRTFGC
jgi:energy-coupling factor transport system ATP-binding protein